MARSKVIAWPSVQAAANAASLNAIRMVASSSAAATGGCWYTLSGSGRVNFGFTVRLVDNKCFTLYQYLIGWICSWESAEARATAMQQAMDSGAYAPLGELLAAPFRATVIQQLD